MRNYLSKGLLAFIALLGIYFLIVSIVSGWNFAKEQFFEFWPFVITLAFGFGLQVGLYSYLKTIVKNPTSKVVVTSGTTSTAAMISCCAHYLTNVLPILGTAGIITFISQYQVEFFWIGLAFNLLGIIYMINKVTQAKRHL
jgi:Cu+-exporting ATPase